MLCQLCWQNSFTFTFGLQSIGVEMHPLLALSATHQEPGHSFSREKSIGLCNLGKERRRLYVLGEGACLTESRAEGAGDHGHPPTSPAQPSQEHQRLTTTHHFCQPGPGTPESLPPEQLLMEEHFWRVIGVSERHRDANKQTFGLSA